MIEALYLRPVQQRCRHLSCLVTVIINGLKLYFTNTFVLAATIQFMNLRTYYFICLFCIHSKSETHSPVCPLSRDLPSPLWLSLRGFQRHEWAALFRIPLVLLSHEQPCPHPWQELFLKSPEMEMNILKLIYPFFLYVEQLQQVPRRIIFNIFYKHSNLHQVPQKKYLEHITFPFPDLYVHVCPSNFGQFSINILIECQTHTQSITQ